MSVCGGGCGRVLRNEHSAPSLLNVRGSQLAQDQWSLRLGKGQRAHTRPFLQESCYLGGLGFCSLLAKTMSQCVIEDRTLDKVVKETSSPFTAKSRSLHLICEMNITSSTIRPIEAWNGTLHDPVIMLSTRGLMPSISNKYILNKYPGVL